jgi:hypothetical protein
MAHLKQRYPNPHRPHQSNISHTTVQKASAFRGWQISERLNNPLIFGITLHM